MFTRVPHVQHSRLSAMNLGCNNACHKQALYRKRWELLYQVRKLSINCLICANINTVPSLPGCNAPYNSTEFEVKATCNPSPPVPAIGPPTEFINFNYQNILQPPTVVPIFLGETQQPPTLVNGESLPMADPWKYLGCFVDTETRVLSDAIASGSDMTILQCELLCWSAGFEFAGVEFASECYCGSTFSGATQAPETDCNIACDGDATETCGGSWRINV
jgi:hypothetical protein